MEQSPTSHAKACFVMSAFTRRTHPGDPRASLRSRGGTKGGNMLSSTPTTSSCCWAGVRPRSTRSESSVNVS